MHRSVRLIFVLGLLCMLGSCGNLATDWQALYERKLQQPIDQINLAALNSDFQDTRGDLTRVAWAKLGNGATVLLDLPAYNNPAQSVVDRTTVLPMKEAQHRCERAIGSNTPIRGWEWPSDDVAYGNTFRLNPMFQMTKTATSESASTDPSIGYCELAFLAEGWELRVVRSAGIIRSDTPGVEVR